MARAASKRKKYQQRGGQKDLTVWDRFWLWVKVNERIFWVILLLLICPAFAFTGPAASYIADFGGGAPVLIVYGDKIYQHDLEQARNVVSILGSLRGSGAFGQSGLDPYSLLLYEREADRLGIAVSDRELGKEIRTIYQYRKALEDYYTHLRNNPPADPSRPDTSIFFNRFEVLRKADAWNSAEWMAILDRLDQRSGLSHPKVFDASLRRYLKAEKLVEYVKSSVQVTESEVLEEFLRKEQFRKLSFVEIAPDGDARKSVEEKITQEEIENAFYADREAYITRGWPQLRVDYLYAPFEAFEDDVELTEEEIEKEYESLRPLRFRRGLVTDGVEAFSLRSPEEEKELESKLYRPLEEVRDEVVAELRAKKVKELARQLMLDLRGRAFPRPAAGEDDAPQGVSFEALAAEHAFLETGTTPFGTQWEADEKIGKYRSGQIDTVFATLSRNAREQDASKHTTPRITNTPTETSDESGLVILANLRTRMPGEEPELELVADEVRDKLVTQRLLDALREKVEGLAEKIKSGEVTLEDAASQAGAEVHTTAFLKRNQGIYLPVESEDDGDEADDAEDSSEPKTEYFDGSPVVLAEAFLIEEEGAAGVTSARDDRNGVYYLVRLDGKLAPDPNDFPESRERYYRQLLADRQNFYLLEWRKQLEQRANVIQPRSVRDDPAT